MYSCCYCCVLAVITLSLSSSKNTVLVCYCRPSSHRTQYSTNTSQHTVYTYPSSHSTFSTHTSRSCSSKKIQKNNNVQTQKDNTVRASLGIEPRTSCSLDI
jgi:hypothetical protein